MDEKTLRRGPSSGVLTSGRAPPVHWTLFEYYYEMREHCLRGGSLSLLRYAIHRVEA